MVHVVPEESSDTKYSAVTYLYVLLQNGNEDEFVKYPDLNGFANTEFQEQTFLYHAANKGLPQAVKKLLTEGAVLKDAEPIKAAIQQGFYQVFDIFLDDPQIKIPDIYLIDLFKNFKEDTPQNVDYAKCLDLWLRKREEIDVNVRDEITQNTPLHFALEYGVNEIVLQLLRKGASMVAKNRRKQLPITKINGELLRTHFNECVKSEFVGGENRKVTYDFTTLMPPLPTSANTVISIQDPQIVLESGTSSLQKQFVFESEAIFHMSKMKQVKELLVHPLIRNLTYTKWLKLMPLFSLRLYFYILLCLYMPIACVVIYYYSGESWKYFLSAPYVLLMSLEIFAIILLPPTYFKYFSTWFRIVTTASVAAIWGVVVFNENLTAKVRVGLFVVLLHYQCYLLIKAVPSGGLIIVMYYTALWSIIKNLPCVVLSFLRPLEGTSTKDKIRRKAEAELQAIRIQQIFNVENLFLNKSNVFRRLVAKIMHSMVLPENSVFMYPIDYSSPHQEYRTTMIIDQYQSLINREHRRIIESTLEIIKNRRNENQ